MDLQATQRRLACREVAQLVNCAVDDLTGTRSSGFDDPSPEDTYPRDPPSGSAEGRNGCEDDASVSGHHEAGHGVGDSTGMVTLPRLHSSGSGDCRAGAGGFDRVSSSQEMPQAEAFDYQQSSQLHSEASQVTFSDCTSESESPPWEEDSHSLNDSGQRLSVGEQEWAAELNAHDE